MIGLSQKAQSLTACRPQKAVTNAGQAAKLSSENERYTSDIFLVVNLRDEKKYPREPYSWCCVLHGKMILLWRSHMPMAAKAAVIGLGLLTGTAATAQAQYYGYYGGADPNAWSQYNYPGYQ